MNDMQEIIAGFAILSRYDDTNGDVSFNDNRALFAGPDGDEVPLPKSDAAKLRTLGWRFDKQVRRWSWSN